MAKRRKKALKKEMRTQVKGILLLALAAFCYVGLVHTGQSGGIGLYVNNILRSLAGNAALVIPFFIGLLGLRLILPRNRSDIKTRLVGLLSLQVLFMIWLHLQLIIERMLYLSEGNLFFESLNLGLNHEGGGIIGSVFAVAIFYLLGTTGSRILIVTFSIIAVLLLLDISISRFINFLLNMLQKLTVFLKTFGMSFVSLMKDAASLSESKLKTLAEKRNNNLDRISETSPGNHHSSEPTVSDITVSDQYGNDAQEMRGESIDYQNERKLKVFEPAQPDDKSQVGEVESAPIVSKKKLQADYILPPLELLTLPRAISEQHHLKYSRDRAKLLESTLQSFGVRAKVIHVQSGPTVTRFEVQPEAGVKVSKIISLSDDLALNLAAPLVRIEAPIPGKAALGIEVPNKIISLVNIREVMEDTAYKNSFSALTVGLGKDITGIPVIADLTKMPHLLIAGATGAGKSVCLNTVITSILYKAGSDQVRFLMIDPKVVELSVYNGIPHLLMPVLTDPRKASLALRNMVREMGRRYDLFARLEVRDIGAYNELAEQDQELEKLPFIVVIIDELADLMLVSPGEVEDSIARLAQMSRAAGIHLIVATQRPSVDVLTGIIKANITSRIAFTVSSQFDSRTILDMAGAEKLLGRGDMLFYPVGAVKPFRVQGAYVSEIEVKRVTDFIKKQGRVEYENGSAFLEASDEVEEEAVDALFAEAVDLVVRTGQASISLLQRRFRIGYTRAARLIDDLERRGVVGPFEGSKPREVLVTAEQAARICEDFNCKPD